MNRALAFLIGALLAFAIGGTVANAGTFRMGYVSPEAVPAPVVRELGATLRRYDLRWTPGAPVPALTLSSATTPVLALYPEPGTDYTAAMAPAFCAWVGAVLDRTPVRYVIVGNEPAPGNPLGYANVLAQCSPIVRAHGALVIGPGMVPAGWYTVQRFLNAIAAKGRLLDAFDIHPYWYSGPSYDRDIVARVHATLGRDVQVWVTEDGVQSTVPGWNAWYSVSEDAQARIVAASAIAARCAGVSVWLNFLYRDEGHSLGWQSGLVRPDGTRKPAFYAYASASRSTWCPDSVPTTPPPPPAPPAPHGSDAIASALGEVGGWARDAYEARR